MAPCIPALARALLRTENDVVINDILWGLSYFTQSGSYERLQCVVQAGLLPYLTKLVEHVNVSISVPALRTIGNVVSSDQAEIARPAIDAGVIPLLAALLDH